MAAMESQNAVPSGNVDWLPNPRATAFNCLFDFDEAQGRLYSETSVGQNKEREFVLFKLTGRTLLASSEDWRQRLTDAHDWVVNGFVAMTNEEIRKTEWEQEQ